MTGIARVRGAVPETMLVRAAGLLWALVLLVLASFLSWWLVLALLIGVPLGGPGLVRRWQRYRRTATVLAGSSDAALAAWRELAAECADRGDRQRRADTLRLTAQRWANDYRLDEAGRAGLRGIVAAVERQWYAGDQDAGVDSAAVRGAFNDARDSLDRCAPLGARDRVFPQSVLGMLSRRIGLPRVSE
ncbi:MAG: hypothetical protein ACRDRL_33305 [Sciscionella sp.]